MKNFKCTLLEQGIHIQGEALDLNGKDYLVSLLLSYEEKSLSWTKAAKWVKEVGGALPTRAQWLAIQGHRVEINAELEKAGVETLSGWYWTSEEYANSNSFAWCVSMRNGDVDCYYKSNTLYVRAVSAFPIE